MRRGRGAYAHDARRYACSCHAYDAGAWREAVFSGSGFISQQQGTGAVIHAAGVSSRHRAVRAHHAFEFCQCFKAGFAWVFVLAHHHGIAFFLGNSYRGDFPSQVACLLRGDGIDLASQGHTVLGFTFNVEIGRNVFGCFRHGINAVGFFHQLVNEAPANGGVVNCIGAAEGAFSFGHDKGGAAHAFNAAGNHHRGFAGFDGACRRTKRVQARAAKAVEGSAGHLKRQARQQAGHVRHIAVVFAGLIGAAINHVGHGLPVNIGVACHQGPDGNGAQIVGTHAA